MSELRDRTGSGMTANPPPMPVKIVDWRAMIKGSLRGFVSVQLGALTFYDCPLLSSGSRSWVGLPGKAQIDKDGVARRDEKGKIQYTPAAKWATRVSADRFSESVIAELINLHGEAILDGDAP